MQITRTRYRRAMLRLLLLVAALVVTATAQKEKCTATNCKPPTCFCRTSKLPWTTPALADTPQFVMLTFDDAVTDSNFDFYRELLHGNRKNPGKGCRLRATFFIAHEYTNYAYVNQLYGNGSEIASHSISHTSLTDEWQKKTEPEWLAEMDGLRKITETYGLIPKGKILGTRAPFLQTSGNPLFSMMKKNNFLYDSSMPTLKYAKPPIWPYTLDFGYDQDCIIHPCPTGTFPGIWEVPLIMLFKMRPDFPEEMPCAMADACIPLPETAKDTEEYLYNNFQRHYRSNKAPFPVFIHESWLKNPARKQGYLNFIDNLRKNHQDVYFVTIQEVLEYMKNPIPLKDYNNLACPKVTGGGGCVRRACNFKIGPEEWETRRMDSCIECPEEDMYPWINKING